MSVHTCYVSTNLNIAVRLAVGFAAVRSSEYSPQIPIVSRIGQPKHCQFCKVAKLNALLTACEQGHSVHSRQAVARRWPQLLQCRQRSQLTVSNEHKNALARHLAAASGNSGPQTPFDILPLTLCLLHAEAPVAAAAAQLHRSIALLAQQQGSSLALRRRLAARAAAQALPAPDAVTGAGGAASGTAAAGQQEVAKAAQGGDIAAAAGDAATAAGLEELRPWPLIRDEAEEAGGAVAEDEAVDVAGDWERGPGLAGIPAALQGGAAGGEETADATARAAEHGAPDPPQLQAATHHGCNFAITLLGEALPWQLNQKQVQTNVPMMTMPDSPLVGVVVQRLCDMCTHT